MLASLPLRYVDIPPQSRFPPKHSQDAQCGPCLNLTQNGHANRAGECRFGGKADLPPTSRDVAY